MHVRAPAIVCAARPQGETGSIARMLTADHGLLAGYVAGGRGRQMRPVLMPGNVVAIDLTARAESQLPFVRVELVASRAPWLAEPLPAAAIAWTTALTAAALPERQPFPALHAALGGLLEAICVAPSARGWAGALLDFEALLLRDLGYGRLGDHPGHARDAGAAGGGDWPALLAAFDRQGTAIARHPLGHRPLAVRSGDVMAARAMLRDRLARIG